MRPLVLATLVTVAALGAAGCMVNPVSGKTELSLISPAREKEIGKEAAKQVEAEMGFVDDKRLAGYVSQVGTRVAAESPLQGVDYTFHVVDMGEPNAFALPGGYVYVTRGILAVTTSEDGSFVAGVSGQELNTGGEVTVFDDGGSGQFSNAADSFALVAPGTDASGLVWARIQDGATPTCTFGGFVAGNDL